MQRHVRPIYALIFLVIIYTVGLAGLWSPYHSLFRQLTPLNLLLTAAVLLYYHKDWNGRFLVLMFIVVTAGFIVEWVGVNTGLIFGSYAYGNTLGIRWGGVPLIIGLNWFLLVYTIGTLLQAFGWNLWLKAFAGALLMVITDLFLEVVAIEFDFWSWEQTIVPLENYLGWFGVSLVFFVLFYSLNFAKNNRIAPGVYIIQLLFFVVNTIIIKAS